MIKDILPKPPWWLCIPLWIIRVLRWWGVSRRKIVQPIKNWYLLGPMHEFHIKVVHKWRDLSLRLPQYGELMDLPPVTKELCSACQTVMAEILDVPKRRIHCTLKALIKLPDTNEPAVVTIGRSEPYSRPPEFGPEHAHTVEKNTVWASLCGKSDGHRVWKQPYSFFGCNDLPKHSEKFVCDRDNWPMHYKSALAFPLRFWSYKDTAQKHRILGFLTFDMPTTGEFTKVLDIFDHDWHEYHELMGNCTVVHVGGIMADTLALLLRPVLETQENVNG